MLVLRSRYALRAAGAGRPSFIAWLGMSKEHAQGYALLGAGWAPIKNSVALHLYVCDRNMQQMSGKSGHEQKSHLTSSIHDR